jgi:hypothetical protein
VGPESKQRHRAPVRWVRGSEAVAAPCVSCVVRGSHSVKPQHARFALSKVKTCGGNTYYIIVFNEIPCVNIHPSMHACMHFTILG